MNATQSQFTTLDVVAAAELLGIRPSTVRKYVLERRLPFFKVGARVTFDREELLKWRQRYHVEAIA